MGIYADKVQETKNQSSEKVASQEQVSKKSVFQFIDNRQETAAQRKLQARIDNSLQAKKRPQFQTGVDNYVSGQRHVIQSKKRHVPTSITGLVVQRTPKIVEIKWGVTHLVKKMNGSIFGGDDFREGEIGQSGELTLGQRIIIDDEKKFLSRRGANQENPENRQQDKFSRPSVTWYHVLSLNGKDVSDQKLYVRQNTFADYLGQPTTNEQQLKKDVTVYWISNIVKKLLQGIKFRIGGSFAAKMEHHSTRTPKDIDIEFWDYNDVLKARSVLAKYTMAVNDKGPFPQLNYFLANEEEKGVSITMIAMGVHQAGQGRPLPLVTVELNNENHRQGDRDFKNPPGTRHSQQPGRMRRASLIAGSLERLSYTIFEKSEDTKEDEKFLRHIISTMSDKDPVQIYKEVITRFNEQMILNPPAVEHDDNEFDDSDSEEEIEIDHTKRFQILKDKLKELLGLK